MTTHFVGQRVRVKCPQSSYDGAETVIRTLNVPGKDGGYYYIGHEVDLPCSTHADPYCIFEPHELEPILPSGHTAGHEGVCEELDKLLAGVVV